MLDAKVKEAENLEGEAAEQYEEAFDEAIRQVKFLYFDLDISTCGYFKEVRDGQLGDKSLSGANAAEVEGEDQPRTPDDVAPPMNQGED